jgi:hypothetical protein
MAKKGEGKRVTESLKVTLTAAEIRQLGTDLAEAVRHQVELENAKAASASTFAAQIKTNANLLRDLATRYADGYEIREVACYVLYATPKAGMKRIIRSDTDEVVREEPMTADELQTAFGFEDPGRKPQ